MGRKIWPLSYAYTRCGCTYDHTLRTPTRVQGSVCATYSSTGVGGWVTLDVGHMGAGEGGWVTFELFEPTGLPLQQAGFVARADRHDQRAMPRPSQI